MESKNETPRKSSLLVWFLFKKTNPAFLYDTIVSFIAAVKRIAEEILVSKLADVSYEPKVCRDLTLQISDAVKSQVKLLGFDRYKIVCVTHIGPKMGQAIRIGSMCCWDEKADNFAECSFTNSSLFAVALIFGVYQE